MNTYFWETAPFFRLLLAFAAGIFCYEYTPSTISSVYLLLLLIVICCMAIAWGQIHSVMQSVLFFIALLCAGFAAAYFYDIRNDPKWFGNDLQHAHAFTVKITEAPQEKERTWKLAVSVEKAIVEDRYKTVTGKAFLYLYKKDRMPGYKTGDVLLVPSEWQVLKNPGNPDEFDYARFCKRNNIYYQQFLATSDVRKISEGATSDLSLAERTHEWAMETLAFYIKDQSTLGLLQAMLLGDEVNFSDEDRQLYVDTGIIHIVAISGGHIAFLMILINACLFWIKKKQYQWIKLVIALPVVIFYVMVAGAPPSAVRAAFVFGLLAISIFIGRDNHPLNTLLAAAFIILFLQPMWLFAVGFQLSFIAVLSLILFYKRIYRLYFPPHKIIGYFWSAIAASIAAEILIAPLVIYYFHLLPALFLIANVVAVLLMTIVMSLGLLLLVCSALPLFATMLAAILTLIVRGFHEVITLISFFNPKAFSYLHLSFTELLLCYICIAAIALFLLQRSKPALHTSLAGLCFLFLSFTIKQWKTLHQEQIVIYNLPRHAYAEHISGEYVHIISESEDSITQKKMDYATKEYHVKKRAWSKHEKWNPQEIYRFRHQTIAFLKTPLTPDSSKFQPIDVLVLEYPVDEFNAPKLLKSVDFKKLIITGNQRRRAVQAWKDSCAKHHIDAHFTMIDGAYVMDGAPAF